MADGSRARPNGERARMADSRVQMTSRPNDRQIVELMVNPESLQTVVTAMSKQLAEDRPSPLDRAIMEPIASGSAIAPPE